MERTGHKPCAPSQIPSTTSFSVSLGRYLVSAQLSLHFWTFMKCHSGKQEVEAKGADKVPLSTLPSADCSEVCFLLAYLLEKSMCQTCSVSVQLTVM